MNLKKQDAQRKIFEWLLLSLIGFLLMLSVYLYPRVAVSYGLIGLGFWVQHFKEERFKKSINWPADEPLDYKNPGLAENVVISGIGVVHHISLLFDSSSWGAWGAFVAAAVFFFILIRN